MRLLNYIFKYALLFFVGLIILILTWVLGIRNLVFVFFIEASLLFIGDYSIKHRNYDAIHSLFIEKFKFTEKRFNQYMQVAKIEFILGCLFIVLSDIALISYSHGAKAILTLKNMLSVFLVILGLLFATL
jgi:hypothetical protein